METGGIRLVPLSPSHLVSLFVMNDPDGIRTRVAALKGPCPRPLDDRAGVAGAATLLLRPPCRNVKLNRFRPARIQLG